MGALLKLFQELEKGRQRRMMEKANSTMIYSKNFGKCHNVSPVQQ
jgi:hypothetical protein